MHNLDPNDMDALFREGADNHEFTYNPEAWALMEEKLDKKEKRKYILWFFLGAMLIASVIGTYSYISSTNGQNISKSEPVVEIADNTSITEESIEPNNQKTEVRKSIIVSQQSDETKNSTEKEFTSKNNVLVQDSETKTKEEYIKTVSKVRSRNIGAQNSIQSENTGSLVDNEVVSVSSQSQSNFINSKKNNSNKSIASKSLLNIPYISGLDMVPFDIKSEGLDLSSLQIIPITQNVLDKVVSSNRFAFTALANSEFSSVGFLTSPRAGWKAGVKFGYQFSEKYQLDLGVAMSLKKYGSKGSEYTNDEGWIDDIMPMWMDAKCHVVEIPLEMSYYVNGYKNDGFFLNAGISSYILNSEWYGFKYRDADLLSNPDLLQEINPEDVETNYHLSGVGKLSFGYQKIISPKMAIEVSPYLQIPLTGIGEGKVDLYTTGVQFAVKFNAK